MFLIKMGTVKEGAVQAVRKCMKISSKDRVVLVTDTETIDVANVIADECQKITKDVKTFNLDEYGKRPLRELPEEIATAVKKASAVFFCAVQYEGEKENIRKPIIRLSTENGRQAHMPNITKQLMEEGMCTDYNLIKKVSKKVYDVVSKSKKIEVITDKGTMLIAEFSPNIKWGIADGDIVNSKVRWSNLPDGEVLTCVDKIKGVAIIDGSIGDYLGKRYGLIDKTPLRLRIKDSRVVKVESNNKELVNDVKCYIKQDENANRIGEFAIGTNIGLKKLIGNLLQDEKFPGVHIAIGHGYPEYTGSDWNSKAHLDVIMKETTIIVDGKKIMERGNFLI
jgi:aminopeptidase